jgi:hypothetical protein
MGKSRIVILLVAAVSLAACAPKKRVLSYKQLIDASHKALSLPAAPGRLAALKAELGEPHAVRGNKGFWYGRNTKEDAIEIHCYELWASPLDESMTLGTSGPSETDEKNCP